MNTIRILAAALLLVAAGMAQAQAYLFVGVGSFRLESDASTTDHISEVAPVSIGLGYRLSPSISAEASYFDPGTVLTASSQSGSLYSSATWKLSGAKIGLLANTQGHWGLSLLGGASVYFLNGESTVYTCMRVADYCDPERLQSNGDSSITFGVTLGASYALSTDLALRLVVDWINLKEDTFGAASGVGDDVLSTLIAVVYSW